MSEATTLLSELIASGSLSKLVKQMDTSISDKSLKVAQDKIGDADKSAELALNFAAKLKERNPELYNNAVGYVQNKYQISRETTKEEGLKIINDLDIVSDINNMFPRAGTLIQGMNQAKVKKKTKIKPKHILDPKIEEKKLQRSKDIELNNERVRLMQQQLEKSQVIHLSPVVYTANREEEVKTVVCIECDICHHDMEPNSSRIIAKCVAGCLVNSHEGCWLGESEQCLKCTRPLRKISYLVNGKFVSHKNFELPKINVVDEPQEIIPQPLEILVEPIVVICAPKCPGWKNENVDEYEEQIKKHEDEIEKAKKKEKAKYLKRQLKNQQRNKRFIDVNYSVKGQKKFIPPSSKLIAQEPLLKTESSELIPRGPLLKIESPEFVPRQSLLKMESPELIHREPLLKTEYTELMHQKPLLKIESPEFVSIFFPRQQSLNMASSEFIPSSVK